MRLPRIYFIKFTVPFDENAGAFQTVVSKPPPEPGLFLSESLQMLSGFGSSFDDLTIREKCVGR